jgi:hypothetical protein
LISEVLQRFDFRGTPEVINFRGTREVINFRGLGGRTDLRTLFKNVGSREKK